MSGGSETLVSVAIIADDGVVHWNAFFAARRASLPICHNLAALYEKWKMTDSAESLLSNYEHPFARPSAESLQSSGKSAPPIKRVVPPLPARGGAVAVALRQREKQDGSTSEPCRVYTTAYAADTGAGLIVVLVTETESHAGPSSGSSSGGGNTRSSQPPLPSDVFSRYALPFCGTTVMRRCASELAVLVRCFVIKTLQGSTMATEIIDESDLPTVADAERPVQKVLRGESSAASFWDASTVDVRESIRQLHKHMVPIGCAITTRLSTLIG